MFAVGEVDEPAAVVELRAVALDARVEVAVAVPLASKDPDRSEAKEVLLQA